MAFTLETGAGVTGANSLASVAQADDYWEDRVSTVNWGAKPTAEKQKRLVAATDYVVRRYRLSGTKKTYAQGLPIPRTGWTERDGPAIPDDVVPPQIIQAVCYLAGVTATLAPILDRGGRVQSESVAGISTTYELGAPSEAAIVYVDGLLFPLLSDAGVQDTSAAGRMKRNDIVGPSYTAPETPSVFAAEEFDN